MKIGAIIAEYNPFHNGHRYQIEKFRKEWELDYILVIMSGNFTQRGEPAWMPKHLRAHTALLGGADLVIELPVYYAAGSASVFAGGAVAHLNALNCIDALCFGCEVSGSGLEHKKALEKAAGLLVNEPEEFKQELSASLKAGLSYPAARATALRHFIEDSELLSTPNNILALEYIAALKATASTIEPFLIKRKGEGYHSTRADEKFPSASAIRQSFNDYMSWDEDEYIPENVWMGVPEENRRLLINRFKKEFPVVPDDFSAMFAAAFLRSQANLTKYTDMTEDIGNRMTRRFGQYRNLTSFLMETKNKAVTYSRLSRCATHILLEQDKEILSQAKSDGYAYYARILGFRKSAAPLLSRLKKQSSIPLIGKMASCKKALKGNTLRLIEADILASDYYRTVLQMKYGNKLKNEFNQEIIII